MENPEILIYTDGSSRGNPGPGGYGIIIQQFNDKRSKEFSKGFRKTIRQSIKLKSLDICTRNRIIPAIKVLRTTYNNLNFHIFTFLLIIL